MTASFSVGLSHEITLPTGPEHTARNFHHNLPDVFATPCLAGFMERASAELLDMHNDPRCQSVGGAMNLTHTAATPLGMQVRIKSEITGVDGKKITFRVQAWDEKEKIGEATHVRFIINPEKFRAGVAEKSKQGS